MKPKLSVIMANHDRAGFLAAALQSIQMQTEEDFELLFADDGSKDRSLEIVQGFAKADPRIKLLASDTGQGPGAARNRALDTAKGEWVAIVDSDDVLEKNRFARLLRLAKEQQADAVADDLLYFGDPASEGHRLLGGYRGEGPWLLSEVEFLQAHISRNHLPPLGYLKPMIRRSALGPLRYDETLRIGEDSDLLLRFLFAGGRMVVTPEPMYHYRRHPGSVSHRWGAKDLRALIASQRSLMSRVERSDLRELMAKRLTGLERNLALEEVIAHLKSRAFGSALGALVCQPKLLRPLAQTVGETLRRRTFSVAKR